MSDQIWQGFGFGEIGYLLRQQDVSAVMKAREALDLPPQSFGDDVAMAAVSSLTAHQLLDVGEDGVPRPLGAAAVLTYAIVESRRWTRIGLFVEQDKAVAGAVVLHAASATVLLQPANGGAWTMVVKSPDISDVDAVWALIAGFRDEHAASSAFVDVSDLSGRATLFADRRTDVSWSLALGESALWPEQRRDDVDDAAVKELLRMALEDDLSVTPPAS